MNTRAIKVAGFAIAWIAVIGSVAMPCVAADGKLIGTAGLTQIEGSGGGGIVPWATLAGYDSREQISAGATLSRVDVDDFRLSMLGASISLYDKVEVSIAQQHFEIKGAGVDIKQNIVGLKYKLYGDVVYSEWPQVSVGMQYKHLEDSAVASSVGAQNSTSGTDFYIAATKVHLGAIAGFNAVWNLTARATKANQMGILGFGGPQNNDYELMLEASAGILFSRHIALGLEYRQKPDNLGLGEDDWTDYFVSYIPSKHINLTLAWAKLGSIAGAPGQDGLYLSLNGQLW